MDHSLGSSEFWPSSTAVVTRQRAAKQELRRCHMSIWHHECGQTLQASVKNTLMLSFPLLARDRGGGCFRCSISKLLSGPQEIFQKNTVSFSRKTAALECSATTRCWLPWRSASPRYLPPAPLRWMDGHQEVTKKTCLRMIEWGAVRKSASSLLTTHAAVTGWKHRALILCGAR